MALRPHGGTHRVAASVALVAQAMTADRIVCYGCIALAVVAMLFATDQMGAGQVSPKTHVRETWATHPSSVSAPTNSLTASDLAALFSRCVTSALDHRGRRGDPPIGADTPAFYFTDPHTEKELAIYCDSVPAVTIVSWERRYVQ